MSIRVYNTACLTAKAIEEATQETATIAETQPQPAKRRPAKRQTAGLASFWLTRMLQLSTCLMSCSRHQLYGEHQSHVIGVLTDSSFLVLVVRFMLSLQPRPTRSCEQSGKQFCTYSMDEQEAGADFDDAIAMAIFLKLKKRAPPKRFIPREWRLDRSTMGIPLLHNTNRQSTDQDQTSTIWPIMCFRGFAVTTTKQCQTVLWRCALTSSCKFYSFI